MYAVMTVLPEMIPLTPTPAMALPRMSTQLNLATAQTREPSSKMAIETRKVLLIYSVR